jgi:hypothetical protein
MRTCPPLCSAPSTTARVGGPAPSLTGSLVLIGLLGLSACGSGKASLGGGDDGVDGADGTDGADGADGADGGDDTDPLPPPACGLTWTVAGGDAARGVYLPLDTDALDEAAWATERLRLRPITLSGAADEVGLTVTGEGALLLFAADGSARSLEAPLTAAELPATLYVQGAVGGAVALTATGSAGGLDCDLPASLSLDVGAPTGLGGRSLSVAPGFEFVRSVQDGDALEVALDPNRHTDRVGQPFDLYLVPHKSPADWATDPSLTGLVGTETLAEGALGIWTVGEDLAVPSGALYVAYDLVLDFGQDGQLDPGDIAAGPGREEAGAYVVADLTTKGPHAVTTVEYSGGRWLGQRTYFPTDIAAFEEARPLVVVSHGNGHSYTWYDYLGEQLASWGYVVMSHENNTGPGIESASETTLTNTDYLLSHLDSIGDGALEGHIDSHRIVWIGHSRGGEGVARAADKLFTGSFVPDEYTYEDIVLISSIAPTVFLGTGHSTPHDRPYHLIAGASDGDVTGGADCEICQFLRIPEAAEAEVAVTYVEGASHNDFNCCGFDDGTGPDLIGRAAAQQVAKAAWMALLTWRVEGDPATRDFVERPYESFHSIGIPDTVIVASQWSDPGLDRLVLDDFESSPELTLSSSGGAVSATVTNLVEGRLDDGNSSFVWDDSDPMNGMTLSTSASEATSGALFDWTEEGSYTIEVPAGEGDWLAKRWLSVRACQQSQHPNTEDLDGGLSFSVTLVDGAGVEASLPIAPLSRLPAPYARSSGWGAGSTGWANEWQTLRLRLADFEAGGTGIDLQDIALLRFDFGGEAGDAPGRIGIDDIEVLSE